MASMNKTEVMFIIYSTENDERSFAFFFFYYSAYCWVDSLINSQAAQENKIRRVFSYNAVAQIFIFSSKCTRKEKKKSEPKTIWSVSAPLSPILVAVSVSIWIDTYDKDLRPVKSFLFFADVNEHMSTSTSVRRPWVAFFLFAHGNLE